MADFPQIQNTGNLQKYIKGIQDRGVPEKVTRQHLESLGYKSKNDRPIPSVLKFIGVLDQKSTPTSAYTKLRNKLEAPAELASMILESYSKLFETYPDAHTKDADTLKTWFTSHTTVGEASVRNMTQTFIALCSLANFSDRAESSNEVHVEPKQIADTSNPRGPVRKHRAPLNTQVAFNIQIQIPGDQKPEVYESIFRNLGKYVLGMTDEE